MTIRQVLHRIRNTRSLSFLMLGQFVGGALMLVLPGESALIGLIILVYFMLTTLRYMRRELARRGRPTWWAFVIGGVPLWPLVWVAWLGLKRNENATLSEPSNGTGRRSSSTRPGRNT